MSKRKNNDFGHFEEYFFGQSLEHDLRIWAIKCKIPLPALDELLKILIDYGFTDLPVKGSDLLRLHRW